MQEVNLYSDFGMQIRFSLLLFPKSEVTVNDKEKKLNPGIAP
jgi:hypothetical protein